MRLVPPRGIIRFWAMLVGVVFIGALWLQRLGRPGSGDPKFLAIPAPSEALLRPSLYNPAWSIPKISPYGVPPMQYYAAPKPRISGPRIAIMVSGIGIPDSAELTAIKTLPAQISFALTPFGSNLPALARAARARGHETIIDLPLASSEIVSSEASGAAKHILGIKNSPQANSIALDWALSRVDGYVGATDTIGTTPGDAARNNFLDKPANAKWLAANLTSDGLFFIQTLPSVRVPNGVAGRVADVVVEPEEDQSSMHTALAKLEAIARSNGSALGIIKLPDIAKLDTLKTWCRTLAPKFTLVPVSALVIPKENSPKS